MTKQLTKPDIQSTPVPLDDETKTIIDAIGYDYRKTVTFSDGREFMEDWNSKKHSPAMARNQYVEEQVSRLRDEEKPLLLPILQLSDELAHELCLSALRRLGISSVNLQLVPGCSGRLPTIDVHGRELPGDKLGKVLQCKTGNVGGNLESSHSQPMELTSQFLGKSRSENSRMMAYSPSKRHHIYTYVEVTDKSKSYSLRDAVLALRSWGWNVPRQFIGRNNNPQTKWLVVESLN